MRERTKQVETNTLGWRLRAARLTLGAQRGEAMSQEEFALQVSAHIGAPFHQTRLSRLEKNLTDPTLAEAMACATVAGVSVAWLAFGFDVRISSEVTASCDQQAAWLARHRGESPPPAEIQPPPPAPGVRRSATFLSELQRRSAPVPLAPARKK